MMKDIPQRFQANHTHSHLIKHESRGAWLVMLDGALAHVVHAAVCPVPEEGHVSVLVLAHDLVRVNRRGRTASARRLEGSFIDHLHNIITELILHSFYQGIFARATITS